MKKTVRLMVGAAGVVPALGLAAGPAAAVQTPAHAVKKSVRPVVAYHHQHVMIPNSSCRGSRRHHASFAALSLVFFSAPLAGGRTCIGDIEVTYFGSPPTSTFARVQTVNGTSFCSRGNPGRFISDFCRRNFTRVLLAVCGSEVGHSSFCDFYPFR